MPMPRPTDIEPQQETFDLGPYEHANAIAATTVVKMVTARRRFRVERVEYINPTGYVQDAANYYTLELRKGATVIASWSLLTGAQGTIAADTPVNLVLSATDVNRIVQAGDLLSWAMVKTAAAANLPLGRFNVSGRFV